MNELKESNISFCESNRPLVVRRLIVEKSGNLRLYRWDDDVNDTRQWVPEWAAVSNPCDIAGAVAWTEAKLMPPACTCLLGASNV